MVNLPTFARTGKSAICFRLSANDSLSASRMMGTTKTTPLPIAMHIEIAVIDDIGAVHRGVNGRKFLQARTTALTKNDE